MSDPLSTFNDSPSVLPARPDVDRTVLNAINTDYERLARVGPPDNLVEYLSSRYALDLRTEYAGHELSNPWGKASGQLSMTVRQVEEDVRAGLGFVVLKTVIAEDEQGRRSMGDWAVRESRMLAEPIVGSSGEEGWTISWKGRGWWQAFDEYLQLLRDAVRIARPAGTLIVPSCKYHLPTPDEQTWRLAEYAHTTRRLLAEWRAGGNVAGPMPIEKDFSPTLAGSGRSSEQANILGWLRKVPTSIKNAAENDVRVGLKLFNALFDDDFQLEMLRTIHAAGGCADYFVYGNRLFDSGREFDGHRGIAYGGPDLSDRNLRVMTRFQREAAAGGLGRSPLRWSATGNISTGKMALEYALRGASSFQLHTFFQLPGDMYAMKTGTKTQKALHELYLHPQTGLIVWMHHLAQQFGFAREPICLRDIIARTAPPPHDVGMGVARPG